METPADGTTGTGRLDSGVDRAIPLTGIWLGMLALTAIWLTALAANGAGYPGFSAGRVAFWWVASMLLLVVTAAWFDAGGTASRVLAFSWPGAAVVGSWLGMTLLAALPRFAALDRFPTVLDADEAAFMVHALEFRHGQMPDPFATGYASNPLLFPAAQGLVASLVSDDAWAYRMPSAALGAIGVLATWRLGARLFSEPAGAVAGVLIAMWPMHLHFSRIALNNITDPTFFALAMLFALRTARQHRALDAVIVGISLGLALYGYYGGRAQWIIVLMVLAVLAFACRMSLRTVLASVGWIVTGFVAAGLPLILTLRRNPDEFGGHLALMSPVSIETFRDDPTGIGRLYLSNLLDAIVFPLWGTTGGFFRHEPPLFGWPLTILVVIGIGVVVVNTFRWGDIRGVAVTVFPYVMLAGGIALVVPPGSHRYATAIPLFAVIAGAGLVGATGIPSLWRSRVTRARLLAAVLVALVIGAGNVRWMASEDRQLDTYGDLRTTMMWDLGWRIREGDGGVTRLLIVGAPYVYAYGFPNFTFLAPDVVQEDVHGQFLLGGAAPLPPDAIMVLVPERAGERCTIEEAYPGVTVVDAFARDGSPLYTAFFPEKSGGFAMLDSPAETSVMDVTGSPCVPGDLS
jgi:4-amino-4-deoxy-L-arabinose transferase-like glycosyltransferase